MPEPGSKSLNLYAIIFDFVLISGDSYRNNTHGHGWVCGGQSAGFLPYGTGERESVAPKNHESVIGFLGQRNQRRRVADEEALHLWSRIECANKGGQVVVVPIGALLAPRMADHTTDIYVLQKASLCPLQKFRGDGTTEMEKRDRIRAATAGRL